MAEAARSKSAQIRANAARGVHAVRNQKRTIDWVLENKPQWMSDPESGALVYGTIRHLFSLQAVVSQYLDKDFRNKDQDLFCLLLVGAYQLFWSDKPRHAIINETVAAAQTLGKPWSKGLINAILRRLNEDEAPSTYPDQSFDHPAWLLQAIQREYKDQWQAIVAANNTQAPMVLRVNTCKTSRESYTAKLREQGIAYVLGEAPEAIVLDRAMPSAQLPGWTEGAVAVQDMGAQYAARILHQVIKRPEAGADVGNPANAAAEPYLLDACAAPGGKLAHLLELTQPQPDAPANSQTGTIRTLAIDSSEFRIHTTQQILARLGHTAEIEQGDACRLDWWNQRPFDLILLDAPCSGTGTLRRHPDIKLLLEEQAVAEHRHIQLRMLNNLWQTLAPGGTLLYCTCSMLQAENDNVIGQFLESDNQHANVLTVKLPSGQATRYGWQLLPTEPATDGFYFALLQKQ